MTERRTKYQYSTIDRPGVIEPIAVKKNPWNPYQILNRLDLIVPPTNNLDKIKRILYHDMVSEWDARIFSEYVCSLNLPLCFEFKSVDELWQIDEDNHYKGFRIINETVFGLDATGIEKVHVRRANFEPIKDLLKDELSICLTVAYDELSTVRGYKRDLPIYDIMGDQVGEFVRRVIGDEGWHYSKFLWLVKRYHPEEIDGALEIVDQIRRAEGLPYQQTFVLDHIEDVFTEDLFNEASSILKKHLLK